MLHLSLKVYRLCIHCQRGFKLLIAWSYLDLLRFKPTDNITEGQRLDMQWTILALFDEEIRDDLIASSVNVLTLTHRHIESIFFLSIQQKLLFFIEIEVVSILINKLVNDVYQLASRWSAHQVCGQACF